jgi:hypothetical protein
VLSIGWFSNVVSTRSDTHGNSRIEPAERDQHVDPDRKTCERRDRRIPFSEWLERPSQRSNHVLWIIGHLARTWGLIVQQLKGGEEILPLDSLFADGQPLREDSAYPTPERIAEAWREIVARVEQAIALTPPDILVRAALPGLPAFGPTVSGALAASTFHESYHVGQLGYLMKWLGHPGLLGR